MGFHIMSEVYGEIMLPFYYFIFTQAKTISINTFAATTERGGASEYYWPELSAFLSFYNLSYVFHFFSSAFQSQKQGIYIVSQQLLYISK